MIENIDLHKIEKQTHRLTFEDGLYDMTYGTMLISYAIAPILREIIYLGYIIFMIIPAPLILLLGKRYITIPRIGIVKFRQNKTSAKNKIHLLTAIFVPLTIILVVLTYLGMFNIHVGGYYVPVGAGIFALILLSSIAYIINYPHFYLYAMSIGLGIPLTELIEPLTGEFYNYLISFGISGTLILLYGIFTFTKFIKTYKKPTIAETA
jgi:hypothetical protein